MTDTKVNFKGLYNTYECDICEIEEESQEHILTCKEIQNVNSENIGSIEYKKIFSGKISEQLGIARKFYENMKIKENILEKREK